MFKKIEILDSRRHAALKFAPVKGYAAAAHLAWAPLGGAEFTEAAKIYPILFPEKSNKEAAPLPVALFSLKTGDNAFVTDDGSWSAAYVPSHIRRYPFVFVEMEKAGEYALALDAAAPHFACDDGEPLFDASGKVTSLVEQARDFLGKLQNDLLATRNLVAEFDRYELLVAQQLNLSAGADRKTHSLTGFRLLDVEKLKSLDDKILADWVRNGVMKIIDAHLGSLSNLPRLANMELS